MPGITILGKLFFEKILWREASPAGQGFQSVMVAWAVANRQEKNPAQIEAEEQTFHRDRCTRGDGGEERIRLGQNQAR